MCESEKCRTTVRCAGVTPRRRPWATLVRNRPTMPCRVTILKVRRTEIAIRAKAQSEEISPSPGRRSRASLRLVNDHDKGGPRMFWARTSFRVPDARTRVSSAYGKNQTTAELNLKASITAKMSTSLLVSPCTEDSPSEY